MIIRTTTTRALIPIILILFLGLCSSRAEAKGLVMLGFPTQYVELTYQYQESDTSSSQRFTPSYNISVPFAILDPTFLLGSFGGSIKYDMDSQSGGTGLGKSSSGTGWRYNVNGVFLKETKYPVAFFATSNETTSQLDFAAPSTVTTDSYGITGQIKNKVLPMNYSIRHEDTKTENGSSSLETVQDAANIQALHKFRNIMSTTVNATYQQIANTSNIATASTATNQASISLDNTLLLNNLSSKLGTLTSSLYYQDITGSFPLNTVSLTESYSGSLGKALQLGGNYTQGSTTAGKQSQDFSSGQLYVEHRLFSSLRTRITGSFTDTIYSTGGENSLTSGAINLIYTKKLPLDATLQLEVSDEVTIHDSKLNKQIQTQLNEQIPVANIFQLFPLKNPRVIKVTEVWNKTRTQLFVLHVDYETQVIGLTTYITIVPTGAIHTGEVLLVTYEYQTDPSTKYTTTTVNGSASYTLFNGKYLFQTTYSKSTPQVTGGISTFSPPESTIFRAWARANLKDLIVGTEYRFSDDLTTKQNTFEQYVYYYTTLGVNSLGIQFSDSYNIYSTPAAPGVGTAGDLSSNSLTLGANWARPLFLTGRLMLNANYQMIRGTQQSNDYLSVRLGYDMSLGKFKLHLDANSVVRMSDKAKTETNNHLTLTLRRYF